MSRRAPGILLAAGAALAGAWLPTAAAGQAAIAERLSGTWGVEVLGYRTVLLDGERVVAVTVMMPAGERDDAWLVRVLFARVPGGDLARPAREPAPPDNRPLREVALPGGRVIRVVAGQADEDGDRAR